MNKKNNSYIKIETYDKNDNEHHEDMNQSWIKHVRQNFYKKLWELSTEKREITRVFVKPDYEYGISFEESIYLYKISSERTVFGHYKAYKKKLAYKRYIKLIKETELNFADSYQKQAKRKKTKKIAKKNVYQYYLFDLEPYTVKKRKRKKVDKNEIEDKAKIKLREVATDIVMYKGKIENEDDYTFIKSFCHASYTPNRISPYIVFDDNGKLKKGCKKYWDFLKQEVSRLSNIPVEQIIM